MDCGGDRKKLLEPLLDWHERFVIRSTGKRFVTGRDHLERSVAELGSKCRLRHQARVIQIRDGQEKTYDLRYSIEPIHLIGRDEHVDLVVARFGEEPMLLLTNALKGAWGSQSLCWIAQIHLTCWKFEETFRFLKQRYLLQEIRVMKYQRLKNLVVLGTAAACFAAADHLAAFLWHSTLPLLCAGRWSQANPVANHPWAAVTNSAKFTDGTLARLAGRKILRKLLSTNS